MLITKRSPFTGKLHTREIPVTLEQLDNWQNKNMLIQNAMPNISPDDREFLMTGITREEWDDEFGDGVEIDPDEEDEFNSFEPDDLETYNQNEADDYREEN